MKTELQTKVDRSHLDDMANGTDDLENPSKRNNVVIWDLKEKAERGMPMEKSLSEEFFEKHMKLSDIEVMRAHRTTIATPSVCQTCHNLNQPRPIHVDLLRYTDKTNIFFGCQIYIYG